MYNPYKPLEGLFIDVTVICSVRYMPYQLSVNRNSKSQVFIYRYFFCQNKKGDFDTFHMNLSHVQMYH